MAIFAAGADMKNRTLFADKGKVYYGPDINDLSDAQNYERFAKASSSLAKKINFRPDIIACDLHPDYFSTKFAKDNHKWFKNARKVVPVQHHHAHIASVICEHDLKGPVLGVSFDGTGYGTDGNIWGGEFLLVDKKGFKRLAHLEYIMMPGGEKAVSEPWRMVLASAPQSENILKNVKKPEKELVLKMMSKNINSPLTSSAGRLFDAAAAFLGVCTHASFEAEGPIKLEKLCDSKIKTGYDFDVSIENGCRIINTKKVFQGMIRDIKKGKGVSEISTKFHNSMVNIIVKVVKNLSKERKITKVALSGGVFQNKYLNKRVMEGLYRSGCEVFTNIETPVNDLNISLGQYYVSKRFS